MKLLQFLPRGEAVLPLLLIVLVVLMFVAWPLADIGVVQRSLVGMLLVLVVLCGLLTLGRTGRFAVPTILLGVLIFVLQLIATAAPSPVLAFATEGGACLFLMLLCVDLLISLFGPGRISVNRIIGAVVVYLLIGLLFSLLFDVVERLAPRAFYVGVHPGLLRFYTVRSLFWG